MLSKRIQVFDAKTIKIHIRIQQLSVRAPLRASVNTSLISQTQTGDAHLFVQKFAGSALTRRIKSLCLLFDRY